MKVRSDKKPSISGCSLAEDTRFCLLTIHTTHFNFMGIDSVSGKFLLFNAIASCNNIVTRWTLMT